MAGPSAGGAASLTALQKARLWLRRAGLTGILEATPLLVSRF
jgi:hypothetical protein